MTVSETAKWIAERDTFIVVTHRRPDGDTLGCAAALVMGMRAAGKTAFIMENSEITNRYMKYVGEYFEPEGYVPSHIVSVDIASPDMFPKGKEQKLNGKVELCIDHHASNTYYADKTCIDPTCAACGELVYDILLALNGQIDKKIAKQLYIAVSTDTGCFSYGNTTARTLRCAADFAEAGAPIEKLNKDIFRTKTKNRIALEGHVYSHIEYFCDSRIAVVPLSGELLDKCGVDENDLEDIASIPGIIDGVEAGMIIRELSDGKTKVSLRSGNIVNSSEICEKFGGGGHAMAAGCTLDMTLSETKRAFVEAISQVLK